jgi:hypothetical protein
VKPAVVLRRIAPWLIVAAALAGAAAAGWDNSATNDEPYHLLAAWTYVHDGHADLNPEHPPLAKLLAGVALLPLDPRPASGAPVRRLAALSDEVHRFLYDNRVPSITLLRAARLAQLAFLIALLIGVYVWSRLLWGEDAALVALLAVASQPLVLGHAMVIHTDVAGAAGWIWTLYAAQRWFAGRRRAWIWTGAALGVALLAKFSTILLIPTLTLATLLHCRRVGRLAPLVRLAGAGGVALLVVIAGYLPAVRHVTAAEARDTVDAHLGQWPGTAAQTAALQRLASVSVPLAHYGLGLASVRAADTNGQGINVFLGRTDRRGFALYFPVALALKTSLPFLLLAIGGLAGAAVRRDARNAVPLLAAAVFCLSLPGTTFNIGARHLMPLLPLLAIVAARHALDLPRYLRSALLATLALASIAAFPAYIAHFSVLVGGAANGARYLNDSNLDWGQDWRRLAAHARQEGWEPLTIVYLGAGCPECDLPGARQFLTDPGAAPLPYVAVSSWAAAAGPDYLAASGDSGAARALAALLARLASHGERLATVGHTVTVYRLPAAR